MLKLYLFIATMVWLFGTLISFGILLYTISSHFIISNTEYVAGWNNTYMLENCIAVTYVPNKTNPAVTTATTPSDKEIAKCKAEKTVTILATRKVNFKEDVLNWGIWGILFLILLLTHYPKFMRLNKKD